MSYNRYVYVYTKYIYMSTYIYVHMCTYMYTAGVLRVPSNGGTSIQYYRYVCMYI